MEFGRRSKERIKQLGATFEVSEYKVTGFNFRLNQALVNKVDTYRKPNGKKIEVHHKFAEWVNIPSGLIVETEKQITCETNDWYVSHRETYVKTIMVKTVPKESHHHLIKIYMNQRFKKQ